MEHLVVDIDPVIFSFGPLAVRWYGLMYVVGFLIGGFILTKLTKEGFLQISAKKIDSLATHIIVGMFLGARIAYVFIYNWDYYSNHLVEFFSVWKGGLSFHGAIVGMIIASHIFARKNKVPTFQIWDSLAIAGTIGLFFGRMGNFINGELYGRVTDLPWGMIFRDGGPYPRHPSQIYEGVLEGLVVFAVLFFLRKRVKYYGVIGSVFLIGYGIARFIVEFFREADSQLGYYFGGTTTMGQILCFIMIAGGITLYFIARKKKIAVSKSNVG